MTNQLNYTIADFTAYHTGTMPYADMHKLELDALNDPFLEDALDGYKNTINASSDIEFLKNEISKKYTSSPNAIVVSKLWVRVAAAAIIFLSIGWAFTFFNKKATNTLAKNEISPNEISPNDLNTISTDTILSKNKQQINTEVTQNIPTEQSKILPSKAIILPTPSNINEIQPKNNDVVKRGETDTKLNGKVENKNEEISANQVNVFKNNAAQPTTTYPASGPKQNAGLNQMNSNTTLNSNANISKDVLQSASAKPQNSKVNNDDASIAVNDKMNEKVVTGYSKKSRKNLENIIQKQDAKESEYRLDSITNANQQLKKYLQKNVHPQLYDNGNAMKGKVILSYKVIDNNANDIKILQPLNTSCNNEAIKALKNAPTELLINNTSKIIDIDF